MAASETTISAASREQCEILLELLTRLRTTGLEALAVEPAEARWGASADAVVLRFTPQVDDEPEAVWEGTLVGEAFKARSRAAGLPEVVAALSPRGGGVVGSPDADFAPTPQDVVSAIETVAARHDIDVAAVDVLELDGRPVVRLRLRAGDDPARFLVQDVRLLLGELRDVAERYVEVVDADGRRLTLAGRVQGWGMSSTDRAFEMCSPFQPLSRRIGYRPTPCPFNGPRVISLPGAFPARRVAEVEAVVAAAEPADEAHTLAVGPSGAELARLFAISDHPPAAGTVWLALLSPPGPRVRWVVVDDATGTVVGSG